MFVITFISLVYLHSANFRSFIFALFHIFHQNLIVDFIVIGNYELKLLESTISKITGLLRVGFGEAGAGIISSNLSNSSNNHNSDSSNAINPLVPGIRIYAIFGFCDILKFEEINQKLERDILTFVNCIADIVHRSVRGLLP